MNTEPSPGWEAELNRLVSGSNPARGGKWICTRPGRSSPSHGENRGSSPLGSANDFNSLEER